MWILRRVSAYSVRNALNQERVFNTRTRALSSVSEEKTEEEVDKNTAWLLKAFLGATTFYVGYQFLPFMGESIIQQSVALLRVKDPLFKRMGASRLSHIAVDDERRRKIVEMGGVTELIKMLETAPDDRTRKEAMKTLASLSQSEVAIKALHHAGAHSIINSITESSTDEDILKYKSSVLQRLQKRDLEKVAQI